MEGIITEEQNFAFKQKRLAEILRKQQAGKQITKSDTDFVDSVTIKNKSGASAAFVPNQTELAKAIGVDRKTIWRWKQNSTFPEAKADGRYNVQEVVQWRDENGETAGDLVSKESEQVKGIQLQNEKLAIQIGILKGDYTPNSEITAQVTEMVLSAKRQLLALPASLAPQVVGESIAQAEKIIKDAINNSLKSLSENKWKNEQA